MSVPTAALSLFDEAEDPTLHAVADPVQDPVAGPVAAPDTRPVRGGGLTLPVLAFAALVASPAIWQCLVRHALPMQVMLERYVVIALGCLLVSEAARRLLRQAPAAQPEPEGDLQEDAPHV